MGYTAYSRGYKNIYPFFDVKIRQKYTDSIAASVTQTISFSGFTAS